MHTWGKRVGPVVAVAAAVALPLSAVPSSAAPKCGDGRAPAWESSWVTEGYPEEDDNLWYQTPGTAVDPATGDVFATVTGQYADGVGEITRVRAFDADGTKRNGRRLPGRTWSSAKELEIQDVVFAQDGRRLFVAHSNGADHIDLVALRPNGRKLWQRRHARSAHDAAYFGVTLVPAADRRRVLLVGDDVAAYDWKGERRWRGRTSSGFLGSRGHYDRERGRFVVPWTDQGYPKAAVSAFRP